MWRFAIEEPLGSVQDQYAQRFKEMIEARSDVTVKVYPYGALGTSDQITELVHEGTIQLATASPGHLGKLLPEVQVFLLHFVLTSDPALNNRALAAPKLRALFDGLYQRKGFTLLTFFSEGEQVWTTNKPIHAPEDFEGVKMRTMTSPLLMEAYRAYGASPTPLPYSEVYSALQLSMIDAQVNPIFAIYEMSFFEVTDYLIFPGHAAFVTSVMASRSFFEGLSEERRALVREVISELQPQILKTQQRYNAARLTKIKTRRPKVKVLRLSKEERRAFKERSKAVRSWFLEQVGPGAKTALSALEAAIARHR